MKSCLPALFLLAALPALARSDSAECKRLDRVGLEALEKNDYAGARDSFLKAAEIAEKLGPKDECYAESFRGLGFAACQLHDYSGADFGYTRALHGDETRLGTNDLAVAYDLLNVVETASYTQQFTRCDESMARARALFESLAGKNSTAMGFCLAAQAGLETRENSVDKADADFQQALKLLDHLTVRGGFGRQGLGWRVLSYRSPQNRVAETLNNYALCLRLEKKYAPAEATLHRALEIHEAEYGGKSLILVTPLYNLALVFYDDAKYADAEKNCRRALDLVKHIDPSNATVVSLRRLLSQILAARNRSPNGASSEK